MSQISASSYFSSDPRATIKEKPLVFWARIGNCKPMALIWNAVCYKKKEGIYANIRITKKGIKLSLEDARCYLSNTFIPASLFHLFEILNLADEPILFRVQFNTLLEILNVFSPSFDDVACQLSYDGYGSSLKMMLEQGDVTADACIQTADYVDLIDFEFTSSTIVAELILDSESLQEAFNDFDWNCELLTILVSPESPYFRLTSDQPSGGQQEVEYPNTSTIFEKFSCSETIENKYKIRFVQPAIRSLSVSVKTQLRMNSRGVLAIQHLTKPSVGTDCFIDFYIAPEIDLNAEDPFAVSVDEPAAKRTKNNNQALGEENNSDAD